MTHNNLHDDMNKHKLRIDLTQAESYGPSDQFQGVLGAAGLHFLSRKCMCCSSMALG